jgi:hypothetical protein
MPWAVRALLERLPIEPTDTAWDPGAGLGHMALAMREYFGTVYESDIEAYGRAHEIHDFTQPHDRVVDFIIMNPPFKLAEEFIHLGLQRSRKACCVLVRSTFTEGQRRYASLFSKTPPKAILQFSERVPMLSGRLDRNASSATSYCWLIFSKGETVTPSYFWIAPCRARLEKDSDYV